MKNTTRGKFKLVIAVTLFAASIASADDKSDIRAVIHKYIDSESFDLAEQTKLMASDRTFISNGMRYTNNEKSMAIQTAGNNVIKKANPDATRIATVEDIMVRVNGDTAVTSFYRVVNTTSSVESVRAGQGAMNSFYQTGTMVLFKIKGDWKIVHTHLSPTK